MLGFSALGKAALGELVQGDRQISISYGSFVLTGQAATFFARRTMTADGGAYALNGQVARDTIRAAPHGRITGVGFRFTLDDTITARH